MRLLGRAAQHCDEEVYGSAQRRERHEAQHDPHHDLLCPRHQQERRRPREHGDGGGGVEGESNQREGGHRDPLADDDVGSGYRIQQQRSRDRRSRSPAVESMAMSIAPAKADTSANTDSIPSSTRAPSGRALDPTARPAGRRRAPSTPSWPRTPTIADRAHGRGSLSGRRQRAALMKDDLPARQRQKRVVERWTVCLTADVRRVAVGYDAAVRNDHVVTQRADLVEHVARERMQAPWSRIRRRISRRAWTLGMSRPLVGSSSSTCPGAWTMARPSATFIRSPCENPATRRSAIRSRPSWLTTFCTRVWRGRRDAVQPAEVRDVLARREPVVEAFVIEECAYPPAALNRRALTGTDLDRTLVGSEKSTDQGERRRLAGAVLAEDAGDPAVRRGERDVADRGTEAQRFRNCRTSIMGTVSP